MIHLVGSCDVNSTDGATLHTLLPINLLKWISNATLGASTDLKLLSQTHTKTKHIIFISSFGLWGKWVWVTAEMSRISMEKGHVISSSSLPKRTTTGFMLLCYCEESEELVGTEACVRPGCYSGHLLAARKQMLHLLSHFDVGHNWCCRVRNGAKNRPCDVNLCLCMYVDLSRVSDWAPACLSPSVLCFVFVMQVEAGWLHGELLGDSAHSEHLSQPRQSPSLLGLLRKAHRSVEPELCVRENEQETYGNAHLPPNATIFFSNFRYMVW